MGKKVYIGIWQSTDWSSDVHEEPVKSLGRVFNDSLTDKNQLESDTARQAVEDLQVIGEAPLQGRFKVWLFQFVILPRLLCPLTIYEIGLPTVEGLEKKVNGCIRSWLGLPPGMSSVALYSKSAKLRLPLRSIVEEHKVSKIRTQWMLNNSAGIRIREVKPLLRTKRKFNFAKWSESCSAVRAELIIQERRREMERERVTKAVQQSQQGRWTTWEDVVQPSISWNEIWKMSPYRLAFVIRSIYDQLSSRDNLRRWGLTEDFKCELCGESPRHSIRCSQIANMPSTTVGTRGDTIRS